MELVKQATSGSIAQVVGAEVDIQVATAKRYGRDLEQVSQAIMRTIMSSPRVALQCYYQLKRRGENGQPNVIEGPSVVLARIVASRFGNFRASSRIIEIGETMIHAQGVAWDLENNTAMQCEVARRITTRHGRRYGDDMISVTGAAACAIAYRNAVFSVIPRDIWEPAYEACLRRQVVEADKEIATSVRAALKWFEDNGIDNATIFRVCEVEDASQLTGEHVVQLRGVTQAYRQGEVTDLRVALGLDPTSEPEGSWRRPKPKKQPTEAPETASEAFVSPEAGQGTDPWQEAERQAAEVYSEYARNNEAVDSGTPLLE